MRLKNPRQKGNYVRRLVINHMQKGDYLVDTVEKTSRFCKNKDLFSLFDIICINPQQTFLIQVTCTKPHTHKGYKEFAEKYRTGYNERYIEQWVYKGRNNFDLYCYFPDRVIKNTVKVQPTKKVVKNE